MMGGATPIASVDTYPFCGACGYDQSNRLADDAFCNSCGADLTAFGAGFGIGAPADLAATGESLNVTFTFTANTNADTTDFRSSIDGAAWVVQTDVTSPVDIVAAEDEVVAGQVRSVDHGIAGPWSPSASDAALA